MRRNGEWLHFWIVASLILLPLLILPVNHSVFNTHIWTSGLCGHLCCLFILPDNKRCCQAAWL